MDLLLRLRKGERPFESIIRDDVTYFLVTEENLKDLLKPRKAPEPKLTSRQEQIMGFVREGHSNKSIANILGISVRTVETHRLLGRKRLHVR